MKYPYQYIIRFQYLGFRFHGSAKQEGLKTIHQMVDKTLRFVLGEAPFKTILASRTDAMVSANESLIQLLSFNPIDTHQLVEELNANFPTDLKALSAEEAPEGFNAIQAPKSKTYLYLFSFGEKPHPFSASLVSHFGPDLNIDLMMKGAQLFEGEHCFKKYCTKPSANTNLFRTIDESKILINTFYKASFFPPVTYALKIRSAGFMRNQIRLIMGQLALLGQGKISLDTIENSLLAPDETPLRFIAPSSGLILHQLDF